MHWRTRLLRGVMAIAMACVFSLASAVAGEPARPNVLVILTDQQSADAMSCRIGDRYLKTPHMDRLAAEGRLFTRAYCANPLCVPSRTSMMTGRYPHETGVQTNVSTRLDPGKFACMGTIFQNAGYETGYVGKWHFCFNQADIAAHGFEFRANLKSNGSDRNTPKPAAEFLSAKRRKPFLLVVSFVNPHNICEWARGQKLPDGAIGEPPPLEQCPPLRPNRLPQEGEPDIVALMRRSYQSAPLFPVSNFGEKQWRQYAWAYYRMIEMVDAQIGQVLQSLRESGQEDRTLVVFTADHGDCQGAHRWNQKTILYEEATRVPLIVRAPGPPRPETSDHLAQLGMDLLPTLCDYAGIAAPAGLPGRSLKDAAPGQSDPRPFIVASNEMVQGAEVDGRTPKPAGRMVRSSRYKYCVYSEGERRESLVDLEKDPGEMVNLAYKPEFKEILQQHRRYLSDWRREHSDPFPLGRGSE